jgi:uncharacterized membrane protein YkoI
MKYSHTVGMLFMAAALALPGISRADDDDIDATEAARLSKAGEILSLEKIVERAHAEKPGQVLETELERKHGRYVYEVEILDDKGQVWELKLDAKTGNLIKSKRDD